VQTIGALGSQFWVTVVGQVVFAWSNVSAADVGALTIWSSAHGAHSIAPSSFGILGASSSDGSQVLYLANVDSQGQTGDVYVANSDGSGASSLLQGQQLTGCFPQLGFAGSYAIASHCDVARGTGPSATISSFQSPGWNRADLMTSAENTWSADAAGTIIGDDDFDAQCTQIFANIATALEACGATWKNVVQFTTYLVDTRDIPKFFAYRLREFPKIFPDGVYPPNTLLLVSRLVEEPFKIEVQTIAAM